MDQSATTWEYSAHMHAEVTQTIVSNALQASPIGISRVQSARRDNGLTEPYQLEAAYLVVLQLKPFSDQDLWVDGKPAPHRPSSAGTLIIYDLDRHWVSNLRGSYDCLQFYVPQSALDETAEDIGGRRAGRLFHPPHLATIDPTVHQLGQALLPALAHPECASRLFVDHMALALHAHLSKTYGSLAAPRLRGGLAPWQERRAKEMMLAHMDGDLPLADLAQACGLSRSHFARAFRETTGLPPHRWLMQARLDRAKDYLRTSQLLLGQIAHLCGYADQSHFTRTFSRAMGCSPVAWRRLQA